MFGEKRYETGKIQSEIDFSRPCVAFWFEPDTEYLNDTTSLIPVRSK
uniref:Uncharacterized protein n=1 Tax=Anguilla anguilla TaxID=7936 RepID=A0A0E9WE68_ANGAN